MALSQRLDLRQSQTLVMTPQLQQAIKLLQLSNVELAAYVEEELQRNPMLEREEGEPGEAPRDAESGTDGDDASGDEYGGDEVMGPDAADLAGGALPVDGDGPLDLDEASVWSDDGPSDAVGYDGVGMLPAARNGSGAGYDNDGTPDLEAMLSEQPTLRTHLSEQLAMDIADPIDRLIGMHLIDMLDAAGWLTEPLDEIAMKLNCSRERVEGVLVRLQRFDPPGIFARDLRECLALQLSDRNRLDPAMQSLLDNLDLLARHDKAALLRICGVDAEDLAEMVAEIRALNPKPAQAFDHDVLQTMTPDILMRPHPDGGWTVELNPDTLPRVLVDVDYYSRVRRGARARPDREYINECFQSANWLVKSLHQRATTILKVASEIVRQQDAFFRKGIEYMKPLVLRDIADAIEMHESTVSRVTTNKYIHTPRGMFELKYFFSAAIANLRGGAAHSAEAVRHRIRSLVDAESPREILSDDRIVEILNADGIDIARRTVAKYREALKIPSSVQRRREKSDRL